MDILYGELLSMGYCQKQTFCECDWPDKRRVSKVGFINSSAATTVAVAVEVPAASAVVARIPIYKLHAVAVGTKVTVGTILICHLSTHNVT
jgi:hypothetical protein